MHNRSRINEVLELVARRHNDSEIARLTGVPRTTIRDWRAGRIPRGRRRECSWHDPSALPGQEYSYLLGVYLGDGYISRTRNVWKLRISLDDHYPDLIAECVRTMASVMPGKRPYILRRSLHCVEVSIYSNHWPCLFPQHGSGAKHTRQIFLAPWQEAIVAQHRQGFVRGLLHSDGCRVVANDRGVASVRYHFTNRSEDIKALFCAALDALEIPWTRPSDMDIAVYRKAATARLDTFVGPKS